MGDLEVVDEGGTELGVEVEHVEQVVAVHTVQVAVGECANAAVAAPYGGVHARVLAENLIFTCRRHHILILRDKLNTHNLE